MALFLREEDVERLLTMDVALEAVEAALREQALGGAVNQPRSRLHASGTSLQMMVGAVPAWGVIGYKVYTVSRGAARFLVHLYSAETGELLMVVEANKLGQMRTGAASGVATRYMARPEAKVVGIVGAGWQARGQLMAVCAVRPVEVVRVYSRDPQRRQAFAREMSEALGVKVEAADSARATVEGADIVVTATNGNQPLFEGDWLRPGAHVNAIGANSLLRREIDEATVQRSGTIVVDSKEQARSEAAELVFPIERGLLQWEQMRELGEVVAGFVPGRRSQDEITLFKSLGIAIWDVAAAHRLYRLARERGAGQELPF